MRVVPLPNRRATQRLGAALARLLRVGDVVVLEGPLGAGKTFLARAIARGLGVPVEVPVASPTFGVVHELPGRVPIVHADFYRLADASELAALGWDELRERCVAIVEWGERFGDAVGGERITITLARGGDAERSARIVGVSERGRALADAVSALVATGRMR